MVWIKSLRTGILSNSKKKQLSKTAVPWQLLWLKQQDAIFPSYLLRPLVFNIMSSVLSVTSALSQSQCPDIMPPVLMGRSDSSRKCLPSLEFAVSPYFVAGCDVDTHAGEFVRTTRIKPILIEPVSLSQKDYSSS